MALYEYQGPGPHDDGSGTIVRPGDVREFDGEPAWGPWRLLPGDDPLNAPEPPESAPAPPPTPKAVPDAVTPPAASTPAPAAPLAPTGTEGN